MKICISAFIFFILNLANAQDLTTHFRHISTRNGLSSDNVRCFFMDSRGFLWIGTMGDGLNRFDGKTVKTFRHQSNNPKSILSNDVRDIAEDPYGRIWVATPNGLSILNHDLSFSNYMQIPVDTGQLNITPINSVSMFKGHMFMGLSNGIIKTSADFKKVVPTLALLSKGKLPEKLKCIPFGMYTTSTGLWVSTHKGMFFSRDGKEFMHKGHNPEKLRILQMGYIQAFTQAENGNLVFMSMKFPGVYTFDPRTGMTDSIKFSDKMEFFPVSMVQVKDNIYWASTFLKGIVEIDISNGAFHFIKSDPEMPGSLGNDMVVLLYKDKQGSIFVTTGYGFDMVHPSQCNFSQMKTYVSDNSNFPLRSAYNLYQDKNHQVWAGSYFNGLYKIDMTNGNTFHAGLKNDEKGIFAISEDQDRLFLGTDDGLGFYDEKTDQFIKLKLPEALIGITKGNFKFIVRDKNQNWWIGIWLQGLLQLSPDFKSYHFYASSDSNSLLKYLSPIGGKIDNLNRLWFGYHESSEITCLDLNNLTSTHYKTSKKGSGISGMDYSCTFNMALFNDYLWITTSHSGLLRFDMVSHEIEIFNHSNGMPSDQMNFIRPDNLGQLWIGTTAGLVRFNSQTNAIHTYHFSDGLPSEYLMDADLVFLQDGRALMTCDRYLWTFNPDRMTVNPLFPKIALTSIQKSGMDLAIVPGVREIDFYYKDKTLNFEFTGINYIDPDKNIYSYKLEGLNTAWNSLGSNNSLHLTTLPAGEYTLLIDCSNKIGFRNPEIFSYLIHVHGPFWKTWWFMSLIFFVISGTLYLLYRHRLNRIHQLQAIRDNISRDLHDDIGSALSSISIYSEVAKRMSHDQFPQILPTLNNIQITAKNAMENMSDIVWAINPKNDRFQDVIQRIEIFANQILSAKGVKFIFDIPDEISLKTLSIQQRKNIYLICKEAINNVAKYAEANECQLNIFNDSGNVVIQIKDNGIGGIDPEKKSSGGNGIYNMKKRAVELKGFLDIISEKSIGTILNLKLIIK